MTCTVDGSVEADNCSQRGVRTNTQSNASPPRNVFSLLTHVTKRSAFDDVGTHATVTPQYNPNIVATLQSDKAKILESMYECIGSQQVIARKLEFAPQWILDEAFEEKYSANWTDSYVPVNERDVPNDANIITSHVVYKIKTSEDGSRKLKSRIVPHGNRDDKKDSIRKDSATVQLNIIRLPLSLVTFLGFRLGAADIKGAYLQSGPIQRTIYVRPPREWYRRDATHWRVLWKLTKL